MEKKLNIEISADLKLLYQDTATKLTGTDRRQFMAQLVRQWGSDKTKQNWTGLDKSPQYFYLFFSTFVLIWGDLSPLTSGLQPLPVKSLSSFVPVLARGWGGGERNFGWEYQKLGF